MIGLVVYLVAANAINLFAYDYIAPYGWVPALIIGPIAGALAVGIRSAKSTLLIGAGVLLGGLGVGLAMVVVGSVLSGSSRITASATPVPTAGRTSPETPAAPTAPAWSIAPGTTIGAYGNLRDVVLAQTAPLGYQWAVTRIRADGDWAVIYATAVAPTPGMPTSVLEIAHRTGQAWTIVGKGSDRGGDDAFCGGVAQIPQLLFDRVFGEEQFGFRESVCGRALATPEPVTLPPDFFSLPAFSPPVP